MKKTLISLIVAAGIGMAGIGMAADATPADAGPQCPPPPKPYAVEKIIREKLETFFAENKDLRKQIIMKETEMTALMQHAAPDPIQAAKISGELFELYTTLRDKAKKAGVEDFAGGPQSMGQMMAPPACMACPNR